jgi:hypothetical protein
VGSSVCVLPAERGYGKHLSPTGLARLVSLLWAHALTATGVIACFFSLQDGATAGFSIPLRDISMVAQGTELSDFSSMLGCVGCVPLVMQCCPVDSGAPVSAAHGGLTDDAWCSCIHSKIVHGVRG